MPIANRADADDVDARVSSIFAAATMQRRVAEIRALFVEPIDFDPRFGEVALDGAPKGARLPRAAYRIAALDGVHVLYVPLDAPRVRKVDAAAAAKLIANQLGDDLLLIFTNAPASQLHFILPSFDGARPTLRRMVVERDLPRRTAVSQVANIYHNYLDTNSIRAALEKAFDVEPVTKAFFAAYKRIFDSVERAVSGFGGGEEERENRRMFVQTLFDRLMFVYFLSRKGWLSFGGDKDYLNALWRDYRNNRTNDSNFCRDRLRPLFFAGLNDYTLKDLGSERETLKLIGSAPFLNGGLFSMNDLDISSDITVPDSAIEAILGSLFDKFNFTVMESTPFDIEVAVDPEMLGKVFEELVTGRRDSGAYYTPRPVVSFMCREALKGYLECRDIGLPAEVIARFVDERDASDISPADARAVGEALDEVTVVDPACGSGAYLLGMMQELVELHTALYDVGVDARGLYDLKLSIIERNLYGVDVDEFAVNIAMLRMWLSLAIEGEGDTPEPLPNLDFKIVRGDSLLGPDPSAENYGDLFRHQLRQLADELGDLKAEHMRAKTGQRKDALEGDIKRVKSDLRAALADSPTPVTGGGGGLLDWRVEFAEVFVRGGFDIAIANPPYIQLQRDGGRLGRLYRNTGYRVFAGRGDVYQLFYERGCQLLRPLGLLAYITSNSWLKAQYGNRQRRYFSEQHTPLRLLELGEGVFESAIVDSCVLLLRKGGGSGGAFPAVDMDRLADGGFPPDENLWGRARPDGDAPWSVLSLAEHIIMDKMRAKGTPLRGWDVKIRMGIKTGYNEAFIIDETTKRALAEEDPKSAEIIAPILRGRDIQRYRARWAGLYLIATIPAMNVDIDEYPAVEKYLMSFGKDRLEQSGKKLADGRKSRSRTGHSWFELQVATAYYEEFAKEKLLWIELVEKGRFAYHNGVMFCVNTAYTMTGESIKYLCALLNSNLVTWFMKNTALNSGMGTTRWVRFTVETIPIPKLAATRQRPFVRLIDAILEAKDADPDADVSRLEREIDRRVYDLYGLTDREAAAIERSLAPTRASKG